MRDWKEIKLGEIANFRNGLNFDKDSNGKGYKIIGVSNFGDKLRPEYSSLSEIKPVNKLKGDDYLKIGDIVFVRSNGNKELVGRSMYIDSDIDNLVFSGFCIRARFISEEVFPLFYAYFFRTDLFRKTISASSGGSNIQNLNQVLLSNSKTVLPPLETQKKIASILSAYDDLIENNLRRIKLLEEMASITYKEWFVNFRIDGQALEINEETGLPFGWENGSLSKLISFQNGFAFKSERFTTSGYPVIKIKNIDNRSVNLHNTDYIDEAYAQSVEKFKLQEGDLLIAMTGATIGKVGYLPKSKKDCYLNQRVGRFQQISDVNNTHFVFCTIDSEKGQQQITNLSGGAAQPNISSSQILSMRCIIPSKFLLKKFNDLMDVNIKLVLRLYDQNRLLKEARDILLPRLMNGTIVV